MTSHPRHCNCLDVAELVAATLNGQPIPTCQVHNSGKDTPAIPAEVLAAQRTADLDRIRAHDPLLASLTQITGAAVPSGDLARGIGEDPATFSSLTGFDAMTRDDVRQLTEQAFTDTTPAAARVVDLFNFTPSAHSPYPGHPGLLPDGSEAA